MPRPTPVRLLLTGGLVVIVLTGYLQRLPLLLAGVNYFLAGTPLVLVELQGLHISRDGLQVQQLELNLPDSGQSIFITDLGLDWLSDGLATLPEPEALRIVAARVVAADIMAPQSRTAATIAAPAPLDIAGLLLLLRDFPLSSIELAALELPDRTAPIKVSVSARAGNFSAEASSAQLSTTLALVQADADAAAQLQLRIRIDDRVSGTLDFTIPPAMPAGQVSGTGNFDFSGRWEGEPFTARGGLKLPLCEVQRSAQCSLQFELAEATLAAWTSASGTGDSLRIQGLVLGGQGTLGLDAEALQWQLGKATISGSLAALDMGDYSLSGAFALHEVELVLNQADAALHGSLRFATQDLELTTPQPWLPAADFMGSLVLDGPQLNFDSTVVFRDATVATDLQVQGQHNPDTAAGTATLLLAPLQLAEGSTLGQRLGQWPFSWDLVLGSLDARVQLQWEDVVDRALATVTTRVTGTVAASLADIAGYYDTYLFQGLNTTLAGDMDSARVPLLATPELELSLAELDLGLPLQDLLLRVQLDAASNSVLIESMSAQVLGGSIAMQRQRYELGSIDNALDLQFDGLRLEQVLALIDFADVAVDGGVSGEVPLRFSAAGIEVAGGRLSAQQPGGNIRYLGSLGAGDASLALVRQALSNYHFDALESSIDYSPAGELLLGMQLEGYNPELENGRRVNLNLNLSNDLKGLLQSLQAGRTIEDLVQKLYE